MAQSADGEAHIYLIVRASLDGYLEFMTAWPVGAASLDRRELADEWRAASDVMQELRVAEASWPDNVPVLPLPDSLLDHAEAVHADPIFRKAFAEVPVEIGLVELDRLVVWQKVVSQAHILRLAEQLGPQPSPDDVFRFCLPYDHAATEASGGRIGEREFAFTSLSSDLRFLEAVHLRPEQIVGYQATGPIAGVIGLVVGFGSNYFNVLASGNRLILNNGNHRACTLRYLGISHAPCVIQRISRTEEFSALAPSPVRRQPGSFLENPRPPLLKDYFDPRLTRIIPLTLTSRQVRLRYEIDQTDMP